MTPQEHENGLRAVARECHKELKNYDKITDTITKQVLIKYLPEFESILPLDKKQRYTPNMWLNLYVKNLDKEINSGS
ncbi:hypothetical protein PJ702_001670 [Providencia rettgeri]|nr:hypothetical protein [Providencia rettgeri]ELR5282980.1 hypothetical protein [Providencia rettgeri]